MTARLPGLRFAAAVGLVVLLVGTGTLASSAYWTASSTNEVAVSAATISATSSGIDGMAARYKAGVTGVFPSSLAHTAPVTVSNTGTSPLALQLSIAGGTTALNSLVTMQVWKQNGTCDAATVADAATLSTGRLSAPPALHPAAASVARGATVVFCVRTTLDAAFPLTELTTTPSVSFTGRVGTNWTTTTTAVAFTQRTAFDWFQLVLTSGPKCLLVEGRPAAYAAQEIVSSTCATTTPATTSDRAFRLVASDSGFFRIYPGMGFSTSTAPVISGRPSALFGIIPSRVTLAAYDSGTREAAMRQQWMPVAHGAAGNYQLVNRDDGLCLTMRSATKATTATIAKCTTRTDTASTAYQNQHFQLVAIP